jgi:DNA-binding response OmpR family regulator
MEGDSLTGRSILVVEDEPLVALDLVEHFRQAGACVFSAHHLQDGLRLAGQPDLSAAVVDFGLPDGDSALLCQRLQERGIPFVLYSGYSHLPDACRAGVVIAKPARPAVLIAAVARLLQPTEAAKCPN